MTKAEQIAEQRRNECKNAREDLNAESKFLIRLRSELSAAKMELLSFMSQVKSIKGDISRADDLVLKEHASHHNNDSERQFIETDIAAFHDKISRLSLTSNASGCEIVHLGQEIDDADEQREVLQRNYRNIMNKKDIASALLVANEFEHRKVARTIESMTGEIRGTMNRIIGREGEEAGIDRKSGETERNPCRPRERPRKSAIQECSPFSGNRKTHESS